METDVDRVLASVRKKRLLMEVEVKGLIEKKEEEISIPLSIFSERLGMLESIVHYLRDSHGLSFTEIAGHLKRDYKTVWATYQQAKKKYKR